MIEHEQTFDPRNCVVVHKTHEQWGELSNMAGGFPIKVGDYTWPTTEALYQACRFPTLPDVQRLIRDQASPMSAKMKGKPHRAESRPDWDSARVEIMRWVLRLKLSQHGRTFGSVLKATDPKLIVEKSHKDKFWGAKETPEGQLVGQNVLGQLLMELRTGFLVGGFEALTTVTPPELPNFLLLRQVVGVEGK
ncbi:MAG: NADAR family protein [Spirochaetales bacterium]